MPERLSFYSSLLEQQRTSVTFLALTHPYCQTPPRPPSLRPHPAPKPGPNTTPSRALRPLQSNPPGSRLSPTASRPLTARARVRPRRKPRSRLLPLSSTPPPFTHKPRLRGAARLQSGKGICLIPAAELGVRRCRHSRPSAQVPALPPPPPAGLKLPRLRFPPRPHLPPHSEARPPLPKRFPNQQAESVAVTGCRFN